MGATQAQLLLSGKGLSFGSDSEEAQFSPVERGRAWVRALRSGLEINGVAWKEDSVRFRAGSPLPLGESQGEGSVGDGLLGTEEVRIGALRVRGDVVVRLVRGQLQPINVISLEDYLAGVLGSEMPHEFPLEALKAQAVAARTYALNKKLSAMDQPYHLGSSVLHQVYGGLSREDSRARTAVNATRGEVLTYNLEPIEAYFHASCGGRTESGLAALSRDLPYLHSVDCPCGKLRESRWELDISQRDLKAALGIEDEVSIAVGARSETGRAKSIRLGQGSTLDAVTFRQKLGYAKLKSLWFNLEGDGHSESLRISGRGYGHGAGLCQWGARLYAESGWNYRQILMHYYSDVELQRLY
jgi:stage II sporulation protein D